MLGVIDIVGEVVDVGDFDSVGTEDAEFDFDSSNEMDAVNVPVSDAVTLWDRDGSLLNVTENERDGSDEVDMVTDPDSDLDLDCSCEKEPYVMEGLTETVSVGVTLPVGESVTVGDNVMLYDTDEESVGDSELVGDCEMDLVGDSDFSFVLVLDIVAESEGVSVTSFVGDEEKLDEISSVDVFEYDTEGVTVVVGENFVFVRDAVISSEALFDDEDERDSDTSRESELLVSAVMDFVELFSFVTLEDLVWLRSREAECDAERESDGDDESEGERLFDPERVSVAGSVKDWEYEVDFSRENVRGVTDVLPLRDNVVDPENDDDSSFVTDDEIVGLGDGVDENVWEGD